MRGNIVRQAATLAALGLVLGLTACSAKAEQPGAAATTPAGSTTATVPAATSAAAPAAGSVGWRGALLNLQPGWAKAAGDDETLCVLPTGGSAAICKALGHTDTVKDWLFLYASERSAGAGAPADPKTLDGSDMGFWLYNGGEPPCDQWSRNERVDKANKTVGGLVAYYGKWQVTCSGGGASFIAQRWLLPKSRLGIVSYALTEAKATEIAQMVSTMDMVGYEVTETK